MTTTPVRKISPGLYGTGLHTTRAATDGHARHYLPCDCDTVEMVFDSWSGDGWFQRWVCPCGNFSDLMGEWTPTLRAARAYRYTADGTRR